MNLNKFSVPIVSVLVAIALLAALPVPANAQMNTLTSSTLSAAIDNKQQVFSVASASGIAAPSLPTSQGGIGSSVGSALTIGLIDKEVVEVVSVSGTSLTVRRGRQGTKQFAHLSGSKIWVGPAAYFTEFDPVGSCTASSLLVSPVVSIASSKDFYCTNGRWTGSDRVFYVPPTDCTFAPTTLTVTNTYPQIGASNVFVLKGISNAAAGTMTLTCNIHVPTSVTTLKGAVLTDITLLISSSATGSGVVPTSLGTSTLGSITFPTPSTTETASTITPVAIGGTVTTTSPTAFLSAVSTDGAFFTFKHVYSSVVDLSADYRILQYTMPILQSAASVSTLYTPGLLVHFRSPE